MWPMLTTHVPGSLVTMVENVNHYMILSCVTVNLASQGQIVKMVSSYEFVVLCCSDEELEQE